jgi:hypothetical protein
MSSGACPIFRLDRERAVADLRGAENDLWPVNAYSDADELNGLLEAAQSAGLLSASTTGAYLYIYPLSIADPDPVLVVSPAAGPTFLDFELKLRGKEGEDPIAFTLRLLEGIVADANALAAEARADGARLDRIAAFMNRPGPWNGGDVCELVATELKDSGREILDNADG